MTDDLVRRLRELTQCLNVDLAIGAEAARRIEELESALRLADAALGGANMNMDVVQKKVSAALGEKKDG
jgi:hypothetical protein